jgi:hypothetical protein
LQLSTNLPCGPQAIEEHLASGKSLRMNVSKEADSALMRELQDGEAPRYARLHKNMLKGRAAKSGWMVGTCARCRGHIHNAPFLSASEPGEFCSRDCRTGNRKTRRGRPRLSPKQRAESRANRLAYQKKLMRDRRDSALAKNCPQPIENTNVTGAFLDV